MTVEGLQSILSRTNAARTSAPLQKSTGFVATITRLSGQSLCARHSSERAQDRRRDARSASRQIHTCVSPISISTTRKRPMPTSAQAPASAERRRPSPQLLEQMAERPPPQLSDAPSFARWRIAAASRHVDVRPAIRPRRELAALLRPAPSATIPEPFGSIKGSSLDTSLMSATALTTV
jgi:hypothetical protein